jgi:alkanesulfonate monooxygenase SsuD/methylene tetrahydromethanopterin reductase-like flavin-dependent oxidoreductase (luciferase family)
LPWHDPIWVAEGIALLDIPSGGRCLFGFGRGAASVECGRLPHIDGGGAATLRGNGATPATMSL